MIIRPAVVTDAESGAVCHVACWREAYAELVDADRLAALTADLDGKIALWRRVIATAELSVVAVEGDTVAGFISAGPSTEPGLAVAFQLHVLNVRRAYWGTGLAQRLYDEAVGDRDAYLWVMRDNRRARGFYARNGFVPDGATAIDSDFAVPIIRMVRESAQASRFR
jgi:GNAT superfamily N-acetyltransferase